MLLILFTGFWYCSVVNSLPVHKEETKIIAIASSHTKLNLVDLHEPLNNTIMANTSKIRVKRQGSGASKFTQAAKVPQIKQLRLFLQMFKNFWDTSYIGGGHPLHPNVPKAIVSLYKQRIIEFFFPPVGETKELST